MQRVKSLLNVSRELRPFLDKTQALEALQHHFASVAPPHLAQLSQVLSLNSGKLCVAAANTTVAAKLRQLAPEFVLLLQNRGCEINGIRIKVQVAYPNRPPKHVPRILSESALNALNELSQNLDDSPLKHALEKLTRLPR